MLHGDGDIFLLYFENGSERFCYAVMQSDIADAARFAGKIEKGRYLDWETPYGYGGPLTDCIISDETQALFKSAILEYCQDHGIVSQFIRFHPLLQNHDVLPEVIETRYLRDTVYIDTATPELIMANMDSKNRNMVRKAQKNGVTVIHRDITDYKPFLAMYLETMKRNGAGDYYIFDSSYFDSLNAMRNHAFILYAVHDKTPVSGSVIFYNDRYMHYHLSGTHTEYRKYSPGNLLLYEAACWAGMHGIKKFHLGGGMSQNDSLFGFKKQFNKNGRAAFVVGRTVFDEGAYNQLLKIRKESDPEFDVNNGFMIQYRR